MKHLIIRDGLPYSAIIVDKRCMKIPESCKLVCTNENVVEISERVQYKPMLSACYAIKIVYDKKSDIGKYVTAWLSKKHIYMIIYCRNSEDYENLKVRFRNLKVDFETFDSYRASKLMINAYIRKRISKINQKVVLTDQQLDLIRSRIHGQGTMVDSYLDLLAHTECSRKDILKIIPKRSTLNAFNFPVRIFAGEGMREVNDLIISYKYYPRRLIENLKDFCKTMDKIYVENLTGRLTESNYLEWFTKNKKDFKLTSEYQVERYINILSRIAYPKFIVIQREIESSVGDRYKDLLILFRIVRWLQLE